MPEQKEQPIHTLLSREIRPISNWGEWLEYWQGAKTLQEMESLLHCGFNVMMYKDGWNEKPYTDLDRIIFYFTIADGWADAYGMLQLPADKTYHTGYDLNRNKVEKRSYMLRGQLARKAYDMLCLNYFKIMNDRYDRNAHSNPQGLGWEELVLSDKIFPKIQNFFRAEKSRKDEDEIVVRNLHQQSRFSVAPDHPSHNEEQAINFLIKLTEYIWNWQEKKFKSYDCDKAKAAEEESLHEKEAAIIRIKIATAKQWLIEILAQLNKLEVLHKWILKLDKRSLAKLKEIALRNMTVAHGLLGTDTRVVQSLDEARYIGSSSAWLLLRHEIMVREDKRLTEIQVAEEARAKATGKINELTGKKR